MGGHVAHMEDIRSIYNMGGNLSECGEDNNKTDLKRQILRMGSG